MKSEAETVLLVDDDDSVRRALSRLIRSAGYRVTSFESAEAFLAFEMSEAPACLVLDVQLPGLDGIALQRELRARPHPLPVVFITGHGDIPRTVQAMKDGAVDFLTKPVADEEFLDAIDTALARSRDGLAAAAELRQIQARFESLTPREREVMTLVAAGQRNQDVARRLGVVEKTIKVHRARAMAKMRARTLADLVRLAERLGLASDP